MFRATLYSSSGELIVSIQHMVYVPLYAGREVPSRPAYRTVTYAEGHIAYAVLIQLTLLMMSTRLLETSRESKYIYIYKKLCVKLADARSPEYKKFSKVLSDP